MSETGTASSGMMRRAPGLQEDQDDEHHERDRFEERLLHFVDRFAHRRRSGRKRSCSRGPAGNAVFSSSIFARTASEVASAFEPGSWKMPMRGGRLAAELTVDRVIPRRQLHPRHVAHASDLAVRARLDDDVAELLLVREPALRVDGVLKCRRARRAPAARR